ncbi:MAG TPA: type II toxin-antitoxin system VapC family toxin [Bryobacteraceae bacterium]
MTGFLLDANCISEINHPKPDPNVVAWFNAADELRLFLNVLVLGEIRKGPALLAPGARRRDLERWLDAEWPRRFQGRILSIDAAIAHRWGSITAEARSKGITVSTSDSLLAATALEHDLRPVTRNGKDFSGLGVTLLNPREQPVTESPALPSP